MALLGEHHYTQYLAQITFVPSGAGAALEANAALHFGRMPKAVCLIHELTALKPTFVEDYQAPTLRTATGRDLTFSFTASAAALGRKPAVVHGRLL